MMTTRTGRRRYLVVAGALCGLVMAGQSVAPSAASATPTPAPSSGPVAGANPAATVTAGARAAAAKIFPGPVLDRKLVTQAAPDECYLNATTTPLPMPASGVCPAGYRPRVNQSYAWGSARSGDFAYFGTGSNVTCLYPAAAGIQTALDGEDTACQIANGPTVDRYGPYQGDIRSPRVLRVDSRTDAVTDITPDDPHLDGVLGLRGGGAHKDVVMLFGPRIVPDGTMRVDGMAVFAFEGSTGRYLGSRIYPEYAQIRDTIVASDGHLYASARQAGEFNGLILKWTGTTGQPFSWQVVGKLPGNEAAYLVEHNGAIAVSGWPFIDAAAGGSIKNGPAKVWYGPKLRAGGLTPADLNSWRPIFSYADYDPDPTAAASIAFGALASWRGSLYVGTFQMNAVLSSLQTIWRTGQPAKEQARLDAAIDAGRASALLRFDNVGATTGIKKQSVTLLYGNVRLPVLNTATGKWVDKPNKLRQAPRFGLAGFGNPLNYYTWRMFVFNDRLYIGTCDLSGALKAYVPIAYEYLKMSFLTRLYYGRMAPVADRLLGGADLWRMDSPSRPAVAEDLKGMGSKSTHGLRNVVPFEDKGFFYGGMAADHNLRVGGTDPGGYQVHRFSEGTGRAKIPTPVIPRYLQRWLFAFVPA